MNKTLKFKGHFADAILNQDKITTTRLDDDKNLSVGDIVDMINSEMSSKFATGKITDIKIRTFEQIAKGAYDVLGMYKQYGVYYNREINSADPVKVITLEMIEKVPWQLACFGALILRHPSENKVLLLKRAAQKKIFPNLITGIGGKVELNLGEDQDLTKALFREFTEETKISLDTVENVQLRVSTITSRGNHQVVLLWFTGWLKQIPADLNCNEGELNFYSVDNLPLQEFTPTAAEAIPFILRANLFRVYNGFFGEDGKLMVNL